MDKIIEFKIENLGSEINFDKINFSNTEFMDRHPGATVVPKQVPLTFSSYDALVKFLRKYFEHFGIDVSDIDDHKLLVIVKTVMRMESVAAYRRGYRDCEKMIPSFHEQLVDFFNGMAEEMEDDPCITWTDFVPKDCKKLCSTYDMHIDAF